MTPIIREIKQSELSFLREMFYQSLFVPKGVDKFPKEIINQPELSKYIRDFGRKHDLCLVAEIEGELVGAIWMRVFKENEKGYGFVDIKTPELGIAVHEDYRNNGLGKLLLKNMIQNIIRLKYSQVSLSVDKQNHAYDFYKKHGFIDYNSTEKSVTMIRSL